MFFKRDVIGSEDISIIIQGSFDFNITAKTIYSARFLFPKSQIILSTWDNNEIKNEYCIKKIDAIIQSKEPEAFNFLINGIKLNNINRLILSSKKGLELAERKYTLRLRSDLEVKNKKFLYYFNKFNKTNEFNIFNSKVICSSFFTLLYEVLNTRMCFTPFHVSDWWHFGYTEDVRKIFDCDLVDCKTFSQFFDKNYSLYLNNKTIKMSPEQYILSELVKKYFSFVKFDNKFDFDYKTINLYAKVLSSNFIPLSDKESGIFSLKEMYSNSKHMMKNPVIKDGIVTLKKWQNLYNLYTK